MRSVIGYFLNMLPYLALALPVYLVIRVIVLKRRDGKPNLLHELALCLFVLWCVGTASQTVIPKFEFGVSGFGLVKSRIREINLIPFRVFANTYTQTFVNGLRSYFYINFLGNILLFVPFGFLVPLLWRIKKHKVILSGCLASVLIEICQLFLSRSTDVDDVILNTLGTALGLMLFLLYYRCFKERALRFRQSPTTNGTSG